MSKNIKKRIAYKENVCPGLVITEFQDDRNPFKVGIAQSNRHICILFKIKHLPNAPVYLSISLIYIDGGT